MQKPHHVMPQTWWKSNNVHMISSFQGPLGEVYVHSNHALLLVHCNFSWQESGIKKWNHFYYLPEVFRCKYGDERQLQNLQCIYGQPNAHFLSHHELQGTSCNIWLAHGTSFLLVYLCTDVFRPSKHLRYMNHAIQLLFLIEHVCSINVWFGKK